MTQKDFEETVNRVLLEQLEETLTPAELTRLKKSIVGNVKIDWDPFEEEDPLGIGDDSSAGEADEYSYEEDTPAEED